MVEIGPADDADQPSSADNERGGRLIIAVIAGTAPAIPMLSAACLLGIAAMSIGTGLVVDAALTVLNWIRDRRTPPGME